MVLLKLSALGEGLQRIVTGLVTNFTSFAPLGTVLVALLGVGVAEHSGLLSAAMRGMVMGASKRLVTFMGICRFYQHSIRAWLCRTDSTSSHDISQPCRHHL